MYKYIEFEFVKIWIYRYIEYTFFLGRKVELGKLYNLTIKYLQIIVFIFMIS